MAHEFEVVGSEILVESPILALRRDQVVMPGGSLASREIVEHFGAVAVVAVDTEGRVATVTQWRQSAGRRLIEVPAGLLDVADEAPLTAAQRELQEESGITAERWSLLVDMFTSPGFAEEAVRVYLAEGLSVGERPVSEDDEESEMALDFIPLDDALAMIMDGRIVNAIAVAGILAAARVIEGKASRRSPDVPFEIRRESLGRRRKAALGAGANLKQVPADD